MGDGVGQRADHRTNLMMEETARGGVDQNEIVLAPDVQQIKRFDRILRLAMDRSEGGEIVQADQRLRGPMHRLRVERAGYVPRAASIQG